jgi:hypothetical protein
MHTVKKDQEVKMFEIRFEHHPNEDMVTIHTKKKFPNYHSKYDSGENKQKTLHRLLLGTLGIVSVGTDGFELSIEKGKMFTWDELKPNILRILKKHFSDGMDIKELPASYPSPEYLESCRRNGSDLREY